MAFAPLGGSEGHQLGLLQKTIQQIHGGYDSQWLLGNMPLGVYYWESQVGRVMLLSGPALGLS